MKSTTLKTKVMSILLVLVMILGMLPMSAFAADTKPSYVALGDSISTGYGLEGYIVGTTPTNSFTYLLADDLGYELTNLAVDGNTAAGILAQLSNDTVKTAVTNADLITITAGGNDLMAVLYQAIAEQYNVSQAGASDPITAAEVPGLLTGSDIIKKLTLMSIALDLLDKDTELDSDIYLIDTSAFTEAVTAYISTLKQVTAAIIAENPDATILMATQYNPYVDFKEAKYVAFGTIDLNPIYAGMEAGVAALNTAIKNNATTGGYTVADVKAAFDAYTGTGDLYNADPTSLNIDFHPTAAGHAIIADTFAAAIPISQPEVYVGGVGMADGTYLANGAASTTTTAPASGGYAYYKDGTLTLNNYSYSGADEYGIYSEVAFNIVLQGENSIAPTADGSDGISTEAALTISGSGRLDITSTHHGIYLSPIDSADITINGGTLNIAAEHCIVNDYGSINFNGGTTTVDASGTWGTTAVFANGNITLGEGMEILQPTGAEIGTESYGGTVISDTNGDTDIKVVIGASGTTPSTPSAAIYVGGIGMADGTYLANDAIATTTTAPASGGYAYYKDGTLTLSNYEYEGEGYWYDTEYSSVIYAPGGLKIVLVGQSTITNTNLYCDGINVVEDLTISGEGALSLYAYYGICGRDITINGGSLDITVYDEGFYVSDGDFTINGGVLNVTANDGIEVIGSVYFNGGISIIDAIHGYMTVNSDDRIYIGDGMEILLPEDAVIEDDYGYYFADADGETGIRIAIGPVGTALPEIYVGGVGMADGTYLANDTTATTTTAPASGGYAYYKDGTLTLSNYTYSGEGYLYNSDYTSVIYSQYALDIVLQGENAITNTEGGCDGITVEADLTISGSGSIDITADYGILASDVDITVSGGIDITADHGISASGDVTVSGGGIDITADYGISASNIDITGGIIDMVSNVQGISCDGTVTFSGGTTTIDASDGYETVGAMDDIVFTNVEILEPEGAVIEEDPDGWKYICDSEGYSSIKVVIGTVTKADQDKPTVGKTDETIFNKKDGSITDVSSAMEYRKEGETTYNAISGDTVSNLAAGKYYVRIKGDSSHNPSDDTEVTINAGRKLTVKIPSSAEQIGYVLTVNATQLDWQGEFVLEYRLLDGYTETEDFAIKVNGDKITLTDNRYNMSGVETDIEITVEGIKDKTLPEAEISISTNKWTEFLNTITFGLFFKETQDVTITATDKGSGVDKIYYLISDDKLKEEDVKALVNNFWTEYNAATKPSISPDRECIVYVKVIDKAQNVKVISSDGLVFDATAPTLEGIENGKTYYGDLTVIIPADQFSDIDQVTLDGQTMNFAEGTYGRIPADNAEHTVIATDKAGNKTEYKITVYKVYKIILKNPSFDFQFPVNHGASFNDAHPDTVQDMVAAKEHHTFIGWYESTDGGETLKDTPYDFDAKVTGDITLYPLFEKTTYTVDIGECHYVGCVISGGGSYQHGQTVTLTASPADGIKFQYWLDTSVQLSDEPTEAKLRAAIVSYDATYTFTAEKDVSLEAVFSVPETIAVNAWLIAGTDEESLSDAEGLDYDFDSIIPGTNQITLPGEVIDDIITVGGKQYRFAGLINFGYDEATDSDTATLNQTATIGAMPLYGSAEYYEWFVPISDGVHAAYMPYTPDNPQNPDKPQKPTVPEAPDNPKKPNSPQTGDHSNMALWFALLFVSGGAVTTLTVYDRKRRNAGNSK